MTTSQRIDPLIGRLIDDRYEVRSRIARGGMATVYLATDQRLERRVAIKVMHGHLADDSNFRNRFVQEARSAARLADPHVVSVFDQGQDSDLAYLVMEYLPGITLRDLLRDHGKLTPRQVVDIMDAVTSGLAAAHRAGIIHRDLKPENVLLADDGRIKISDFGLARAASANTATGQSLLGTIAYLSPELVTRGVADARSDIYALGIMMYEMLTGEQPYKGEQPMQIAYQHANESVPRPSVVNPSVPDPLDDLVLWATERSPDERPSDARELLERLREVEKQLGFASTATAAHNPTMLMPAAPPISDTAEFTQALTSANMSTDPVAPEDATSALRTTTARRRKKGWWVLAFVLMLAAVSGGTGWYFAAGPGSQVSMPDLVNSTPEEATAILQEMGLQVEQGSEYSFDVASGLVSSTDPGPGSQVVRDSAVTVNVSLGRAPVTVPALAGMTLEETQSFLTDNRLTVGTVDKQFNRDVESDVVISAVDPASEKDLSAGGEILQGETVNLAVSVGAIPNGVGLSPDAARAAFEDVGLVVSDKVEERFSDEIDKGLVLSVIVADGVIRPGDDVSLVVSKGVDLVPIPDVVGMLVADAIQKLQDAGFKTTVESDLEELFWAPTRLTVDSIDPEAGESARRGSTITVTANILD
ncbi:Stk1 family PASTA domain-containing Ser/Thr kinase [Mycetocola manganoxydans]|uniref:non-specific serine/threonine protein kinase n=1 Tax=Mycetocola manganoxydans TaxID=699879 RepID=A0A3L6ZWJ8_9MICO|nr:Stk1 family PASTA domain-containing Ser/Thr kinase [Mycetocola manganoxydans]RLP72393.1 Stk1 family PASTA domain-containing Ser/Thr kinase [Mycetocola manganoxydans]GHD40575.1 serine/threonine protein kinase [Mycetocola manganoxydans]